MYQVSENEFFLKKSKEPLDKELEYLVCHATRAANNKVYSILQNVDPRDVSDASGTTLLHLAANFCNTNVMRYLIRRGCEIDAKDNLGQTPVMVALQRGYLESIELLLEAEADIHIVDSTGQSALQMILNKPDQPYPYLVKLFLKRATNGCNSNEEIAKVLRDVNCPLDCVVCLNNVQVTKMMLERGYFPEIDAQRYGDNTALHLAVFMTDAENVEILLEHKANVNVRNMNGETPLMMNFFNRGDDQDLRILKALLEHGADLTALDSIGKMQVYQLLTKGKRKAVRMLLQHGLDLNAKDELQFSPVFYLLKNKNPHLFKELRNKKVDWNARGGSGCSILHAAMSRGDSKIVRFLISMGVDVNAMDDDGRTPLFHAFIPENMREHRQCVEILLQNGAEIQLVSYVNDTVIDIAHTFYNFDTVEPILAHLALLKELGTPIIDNIRIRIESNSRFQECYVLHQQQLKKMKSDVVYGTVTMFKILTESEDKIAQYAKKQDTVERIMECSSDIDSYYYEILRKRLVRAQDMASLRKQAVLVLCDGLDGLDDIILDKIIRFLSYKDLQKFRV